jgi:hypothetical protein
VITADKLKEDEPEVTSPPRGGTSSFFGLQWRRLPQHLLSRGGEPYSPAASGPSLGRMTASTPAFSLPCDLPSGPFCCPLSCPRLPCPMSCHR